jgi:hypothetical protein
MLDAGLEAQGEEEGAEIFAAVRQVEQDHRLFDQLGDGKLAAVSERVIGREDGVRRKTGDGVEGKISAQVQIVRQPDLEAPAQQAVEQGTSAAALVTLPVSPAAAK